MKQIQNKSDTNHILISDIEFQVANPAPQLSDFVESFWMIKNKSASKHEIVILPDGKFDIIYFFSPNEPLKVCQTGLENTPKQNSIPSKTILIAVSFKLLAIEYLLKTKTASLLNSECYLPENFWEITINDQTDFETFYKTISKKMIALIPSNIDGRKRKLFDLIYSSNGSLTVKELSEKVFWSSRQINRYFNVYFGISLKTYCNIIRFKTSLDHIKEGKLFPEQNFADQTHFIKEVKKFSGVVPKELLKNQNDRFILLSALPKK